MFMQHWIKLMLEEGSYKSSDIAFLVESLMGMLQRSKQRYLFIFLFCY
jgi:hypothetical protein